MKKFLLPLAVLAAAAILSVILYVSITETYKDWQTTTGTLTDIEITDRRKHAGKLIRYEWSYTVDGTEYTGSDRFSYNGQTDRPGDEREIWYDPAKPSESALSRPSPDLEICIPFFFAVPVMMLLYHVEVKKEKQTA